MVGNDVVDLTDPEVRPGASHPRFDRRAFVVSEREALRSSGAPNRLRWMLWAAKEAAFKVVKKRDPDAVFLPSRFVVSLDASLRGLVRWAGLEIPVEVFGDSEAVHAIATDVDAAPTRIVSAVETTDEGADASRAVRELAVRAIAARLEAAPEDIIISRSERIPTLEVVGVASPVDLSLSHHGRFVAFACDLGSLGA
jgi:phosphopantetheinyl transferase (holo-ACP synthase)